MRTLTYLRPYRLDVLGAVVSLLVLSAANMVVPLLIRYGVDAGVILRQQQAVVVSVLVLAVIIIVRGVFIFLQNYLAERASQRAIFDLRELLFSHIQRLSFSYHDRTHASQLLIRLTSDLEQVRAFLGLGLIQLASAAIMLAATTALLLYLNLHLTLAVLAVLLIILILLAHFVARLGPLFADVQQALTRLNTVLQEGLTGVRVIRAFSREDFQSACYGSANRDLLEKSLATFRSISNHFPLVLLLANVGGIAIIWYGGLETIGGRLSMGELIAFHTCLSFLLFPIMSMGFLASTISRAAASSRRIFEVLDAPLAIKDLPGAKALPIINGLVEFKDVHFAYPGAGHEALRGLSFTIVPGQVVAMVGRIGSGKSTAISLLPRFYDTMAGSILIDGHDIRQVTLESLRRQVGIVLQQAFLFSGSVRDNICYGKPGACQAEVEAAARLSQADTFIRELPQGYDTQLGELGAGLSRGQLQRIALARALLISPRLLLLDDSTSAVDAGTAAVIQQALDGLVRDDQRTVLIVAHSVNTARRADLILVLDEGRLVAQGTHERLLRECPLYEELFGSHLVAQHSREPRVDRVRPAPAETNLPARGERP